MENFEIISAKMLWKYMNRSDTLIIDMRSQEEYYEDHLPGAIHIPYEEEAVFFTLPREKIIVLCCARGSASLVRAKEMARQGYQVKSVSSGVKACRDCGMMMY
jgi:rhodanese-related sulfurtransferase